MNIDDIIYLSLLLFSMGFGYYYRPIKDKEKKKWIGTAAGLFIIGMVSGLHYLHHLITVLVNSFIILFLDKRKCHIISFIFSFSYLLFFRSTIYFGIPYPPGHTNLIQMILTLKLVGLAFEVNQTYLARKKRGESSDENVDKDLILKEEYNAVEPTFLDIFHYSFNYIGVLTGPYFKYTTFVAYFDYPFHHYADWKSATIKKLTYVPLFIALFLIASYIWPLSYAFTDEFYNERSWLYRYWYIWPNFFIFRMRIYTGLTLSECVCTIAGFGTFPTITEAKVGSGPSRNFEKLKEIASSEAKLKETQYDFETTHNINPYEADFGPTFRQGMKNWNMCVQYWLAVYIFRRVPMKQLKIAATFFVSSFWHGVYGGYYVCLCSVPPYLILEDLLVKVFIKENSGWSRTIWEWIIRFLRMNYYSYFSIAFHLLHVGAVVRFYNSIYHCGLILAIILYGIGFFTLKRRRKLNKLKSAEETVATEDKKLQ